VEEETDPPRTNWASGTNHCGDSRFVSPLATPGSLFTEVP
jgi:hypothetical protein